MGAMVSIAQFKTALPLRLINCMVAQPSGFAIFFEEPDAAKRQEAVWKDIDRAFSRPVTIGEDVADYAPTRIMAEAFREHGFDGIAYRSSLGPGHNVALFELDAAQILNCALVEITSVKLEYQQAAGRYFLNPIF
jgi:hypothetical protein